MLTSVKAGGPRLQREAVRGIASTLVLIAFGLGAPACALADTLQGLVVAVQDGDTLTVLDVNKVQHRIRLAGIDAPEKGQPFGHRSKEGLSDQAYRQQVSVEWHKVDRYGRVVGKVLVNGRDVNLAQVTAGLAWHYAEYAKEQLPADRSLYADAEVRARERQLGLWQESAPVAPWDYRRGKREGPTAAR